MVVHPDEHLDAFRIEDSVPGKNGIHELRMRRTERVPSFLKRPFEGGWFEASFATKPRRGFRKESKHMLSLIVQRIVEIETNSPDHKCMQRSCAWAASR